MHPTVQSLSCGGVHDRGWKYRLSRISQMTSHTLAHELRQTFKNKVFDAFDAKVTGEPDG